MKPWPRLLFRAASTASLLAALAGCGGGGSAPPPASSCSIDDQKSWLRAYLWDWYLWFGTSPNPVASTYETVERYFYALLFQGDSSVPADRWSYVSQSESFEMFFEQGKTLGYGIFVNGLEGKLPLRVRFVEPLSPAALQGLKRGDEILSLNGVSAQDLLVTGDFSALMPGKSGESVTLTFQRSGVTSTVALRAENYSLTPVPAASVLTSPKGSKVGYIFVKDMITQAEDPMAQVLDRFLSDGVSDVIVDLRYNGGGRISTTTKLASHLVGASASNKVFSRLVYNVKHSNENRDYRFSPTGKGFSRVLVLTGPRSCSASELLVNGLKPHLQVVTLGSSTCGKPFGFNPVSSCEKTFSAVNFETFNALGQGGYYDGIAPTCSVNDSFVGELGTAAENLTSAALFFVDAQSCQGLTAAAPQPRRYRTLPLLGFNPIKEPAGIDGMIAD